MPGPNEYKAGELGRDLILGSWPI